jgi:hypothetical protein
MAVMMVPTGGTHLNLGAPEFSQLQDAIKRSIPLMFSVEGPYNVAYRFDPVGSGPPADPYMHVYGPTAANQSGVLFTGERTTIPEMVGPVAEGLAIRGYPPLGTSAVGTGILRIWSTSG